MSSIHDAECLNDLEINKDYIVEMVELPGLQHIRILFKTENVCLVEFIDPNDDEKTTKKWYKSYVEGFYGGDEPGLYCVHEELTGYTRGKKIDDLIGEEKG